MRIAVIVKPANSVGSSNEALNFIRHRPDIFIPVASTPIGGKPGLTQTDTLYGSPFYYPVANLMAGLKELDPDAVLICTISGDVYHAMPEMMKRWPVAWRYNVNPLEFTFDQGMAQYLPHFFSILGGVDAVIPCTEFVEDNLKQLGIENTAVIPTCLDTEECELADPTTDLVVSLTRIAPIKNIIYSVLAMGKIVNEMPTAEYKIYGEGSMSTLLTQMLRGMHTERITYEGFRPADEVLPKAKVFLQTSISENFSLSVLEAMAHGIPVVASDIPGHAVGGVYFDSIKEIADDVRRLLTDDGIWEVRRKMGLEKVKEFDVRKVVPKYIELFEKLMKLKEFKKAIK